MLSLLSGLSCFQHASFRTAAMAADDALGLCQVEALPRDIRATLGRRFYGWKVQESIDLVAKARQKWASIAPLACPGIAAGHFEDSRSVAYGLLLVPADSSANGYKFVVFSAPSGQAFYRFRVLDQGALNASAFFAHAVAVDRVLSGDLKKRLRAQGNEGILLSSIAERNSTHNVYFWTGESYDHAQVDFQPSVGFAGNQ